RSGRDSSSSGSGAGSFGGWAPAVLASGGRCSLNKTLITAAPHTVTVVWSKEKGDEVGRDQFGRGAPTAARTRRSSSDILNGFWRNPVTPARVRHSGTASSVNPLQRITGTDGSRWRIAAIASAPSIRGIVRSSRTALIAPAWALNTSTPSCPSHA